MIYELEILYELEIFSIRKFPVGTKFPIRIARICSFSPEFVSTYIGTNT